MRGTARRELPLAAGGVHHWVWSEYDPNLDRSSLLFTTLLRVGNEVVGGGLEVRDAALVVQRDRGVDWLGEREACEDAVSGSLETAVVVHVKRIDAEHIEVRTKTPKGAPTDLDLSLTIGQPTWTLDTAIHRDQGQDGYMLLPLATPDAAPSSKRIGKDVTLVLDIPGSMAGPPLDQAKLAAIDVLGGRGSCAWVVKIAPQCSGFERLALAPSGAVT